MYINFVSKNTVLDEYEITDRNGRKLNFLTTMGAVIPPSSIFSIIEQYKNCACFALNMVFTDTKEPSSVTAIVSHFLSKHCLMLKICWNLNLF